MQGHETFILTIFHDPARSSDPRGRLRHVTSGQEITFVDLNELVRLLRQFVIKKVEQEEGKDNETQA